MGIPATEAFNKVLCADEEPDVKKKLYGWWGNFFEVLSNCEVPKENEGEFNEKVDALMAEILKAGSAEASNEVVLESDEVGYEQADKEDEDEMMKDLKFAIQHIGEIANKAQELLNFVNPWVKSEVSENLTNREVKQTMKENELNKNDDGWVSMDSLIGVHETSGEFKVGDKITWKHHNGSLSNEIVRELTDGGYIVDGGYAGASEVYPGWVDEELTGMSNMELIDGEWQRVVKERKDPWEKLKMGRDGGKTFDVGDHVKVTKPGDSKGWKGVVVKINPKSAWPYVVEFPKSWQSTGEYGANEIWFDDSWEGEEEFLESDLENELNKGDDGWIEVGQPVGEASDEPLEATKFIEAMMEDDDSFGGEISFVDGEQDSRGEVKILFTTHDRQFRRQPDKTIMDMLDAEARKFGWALANFGWKDNHEDFTANFYVPKSVNEATVVVDADTVWDVLELLDDDVANHNLTELINSHVRTEDEIMDAIENILGAAGYSDNVPKAALNGMFSSDNIHELVAELGLDVDAYMDRGVIQDAEKPVALEGGGDEVGGENKPDEVQGGQKTFKNDNGQKQELVTGEKSHFNEMTIAIDIDNADQLLKYVWGKGKENLEGLIETFGGDIVMEALEAFDYEGITALNYDLEFDWGKINDKCRELTGVAESKEK